jgi:superfamily II DNA or RNA helicase
LLKDINFKIFYNTSVDNISKEFFYPCLENSIEYKRGVGYFTSGWLSQNSKGLARFIQNGGKAKYIISPIIDKEDLESLQGKFYYKVIDKNIISNLESLEKELEKNTKNLLGWLVYDGLLEFRFAIPKKDLYGGDFHDKFGIFIDKEENIVTFNGSMNETLKGFLNSEAINVFCSWKDTTSREMCKILNSRFSILWDNKDDNIFVYQVNDVVKNKLIKFRKKERPYKLFNKETLKSKIILRDYQLKAYKNWKNNNNSGILSMATGSGKTITAFNIINNIISKENIPIVIVVPYQHLVTQWAKEAKKFGMEFIECFHNSNIWFEKALKGIKNNSFFITTNNTFIGKKFQYILSNIKEFFLIVDEVHNFGSRNTRKFFPNNVKYKLGLTATPNRYFDEEGTNYLLNYFGGIVFEFTLENAIKMGFLTPYKYYPIIIYLTENEEEEYINLSKKISLLYNREDKDDQNTILQALLIKRSKIIKKAINKIYTLKQLIKEKNLINTKYNLFYCDSGKISDKKMVDEIYDILTSNGMNVQKFTSFDTVSKEERQNLLKSFEEGIVEGLVAIKCLDEGVDIPAVKRAFLLSSSGNLKEFIQRRGRILRKYSSKEFAEIYDFIVVPKNIGKYSRNYFVNELKRYKEFAKLAINYIDAEKILIKFMEKNNIYV